MNVHFRKVDLLGFAYLYVCVSPLLLAICYFFVPSLSVSFISLKDFGFYGFAIFAVLYATVNRKLYWSSLVVALVMLALVLSFLLSPALSFVKLASIRQISSIFLIIFMGSLFSSKSSQTRLYAWILAVASALTGFGFVERFGDLWSSGLLSPFFRAKGIGLTASGYPFFFIEPIAGGFLRMVSTFLDPINFGHNLVAWLALAMYLPELYEKPFIRRFSIALMLVALGLCFSKGAWLHFLISCVILNHKINLIPKFFAILFGAIMSVFLALTHPGVKLHLEGFASSFESLSFFGHGLGMAGNYAVLFGDQAVAGISDTFMGALLGQLGILGTVLWLLAIFFLMYLLPKHSIAFKLMLGQLFIAAVSENAFNFSSIITVGVIFGAELGQTVMIRRVAIPRQLRQISKAQLKID